MSDLWMTDFERAFEDMDAGRLDPDGFRERMRALGLDDEEIDEHLVSAGAALA